MLSPEAATHRISQGSLADARALLRVAELLEAARSPVTPDILQSQREISRKEVSGATDGTVPESTERVGSDTRVESTETRGASDERSHRGDSKGRSS